MSFEKVFFGMRSESDSVSGFESGFAPGVKLASEVKLASGGRLCKQRFYKLMLSTTLVCGLLSFAGCSKDLWKVEEVPVPITFTFFNTDSTSDMLFNDPVAKEITRRTGVTLEVDHLQSGHNQDFTLMITSGHYDDLIYAKSDMIKLIDVKAIIPLDDYVDSEGVHHNLIEEYGANFKKLYGDELVKLKHTDGHIYSFGTYNIKTAIFETSGTFQLQHAVLKELGYPKLETLDDYANAIRAYKKQHPAIDGNPTIGLSLLLDSWRWYIDFSNTANYVIGYPDDGQWIVDRTTHEAKYKFLNPEISAYYKWLNELYHDGTLDPESFTQSEDVWRAKIASGRVLGLSYPSWGYMESRTSLIADGKPERTYAYLPIVANTKYKDPSLTDYGYSGGWGISISKDCKDVIRAFKFLDWMCSEEAQILVNWGIEGVNYEVIDGKRVIPAEEQRKRDTDPNYATSTGIGRWIYPFPEAGDAAVDSNGDWITRNSRQMILDTYLPVERETLDAYGAEMWTDLFPQSSQLPKPVHGQVWQYQIPSDVNAVITAADEYVRQYLIQCVICEPAEFDTLWQEMVQGIIDMGIEDASQQVTKIIGKKLELWGIE